MEQYICEQYTDEEEKVKIYPQCIWLLGRILLDIQYDKTAKYTINKGIDCLTEKIGYKIREARLQKIPYMLVVGAKEEEENTVSVRSRFAGDEGAKSLDDFIAAITEEIKNRENRKVEVEEQK